MMKYRASITQRTDELKGVIELEGDPGFMLDCLALQVEALAKEFGVTAPELVRDLYSVVCGKVK